MCRVFSYKACAHIYRQPAHPSQTSANLDKCLLVHCVVVVPACQLPSERANSLCTFSNSEQPCNTMRSSQKGPAERLRQSEA